MPPASTIGGALFQAALGVQALADPLDFGLSLLECARARRHRVVAEYQIMRASDGRAERETGVAACQEFRRLVRLLEHCKFARPDRLGPINAASVPRPRRTGAAAATSCARLVHHGRDLSDACRIPSASRLADRCFVTL